MNNNNLFEGENSLKDFLNPQNHLFPLVEIPQSLNEFRNKWVRIYAKMLNLSPLLNVKSIPAYNMLDEYNNQFWVEHISELIESSSWNTVYSLWILWKVFWINNTISMASSEVSEWKLKLLQFFDVETILNEEPICPNPNDPKSGISKARELWKQEWKLNLWQYENDNNRKWHYKMTWPQIYRQLSDVNLFCAWLWTTWTFLWTIKYLKEQNEDIKSVWIVRKPNNPIPWPRTRNLLNQIDFYWEEYVDYMEYVWTVDSYKYSLMLSRNGILWWPSSWMNLKWLIQYIRWNMENIKKIIDTNWEYKCVFVCCDTPLPYIDEYFKYLSEDNFPKIHNLELLKSNSDKKLIDIWIDPISFVNSVYGLSMEELSGKVSKDLNISVESRNLLVDLRTNRQFNDHWLPWFINVPFEQFKKFYSENYKIFEWKNIYLICEFWEKSAYIWEFLLSKGYNNIFSIEWWTIERSNRGYPRFKCDLCGI